MQSATLLILPPRGIPLKHRRTHCVLCNECIRTADARRIVRGSENSVSASPLVYSDYALQECSPPKVTAAYALNYLELRVLKPSTVLYNAIKEYHDDRIRKTIYFYGHTIEEDYNCAGKREDNILTIDECRTGHSNEEDIEADEREELELEDCDALVERYKEEINCSDLYSTM
ncbi:hypothetical protein HBI88_150450 [Parastagonospora nodorum]|nr:hypothetical protein HBI93_011920 [Parastagonospora nodorum]KAH5919770.1 hypothetical protein HBI88_150450 [Parastagonospora nodorum]